MKYFIIFLILIMFVGVSFALDQEMKSDDLVVIKLHQTMSVNDLDVTFDEINDSRCPSDVTCIWQGMASVVLRIYDHSQYQTIVLTTETPLRNIGTYEIRLIDVSPYPISTKNISQDYVVSIIISKNEQGTILPPLKQFKNGINPELVECTSGLSLIIKTTNGHPACVKPETKIQLIERNWAMDMN